MASQANAGMAVAFAFCLRLQLTRCGWTTWRRALYARFCWTHFTYRALRSVVRRKCVAEFAKLAIEWRQMPDDRRDAAGRTQFVVWLELRQFG